MSTAPKTFLSPQEYLAQGRVAEFKSQCFHGEVFATPGASRKHNLVVGWLLQETQALIESVTFESMDVTIPMAEIYRNISFEESES